MYRVKAFVLPQILINCDPDLEGEEVSEREQADTTPFKCINRPIDRHKRLDIASWWEWQRVALLRKKELGLSERGNGAEGQRDSSGTTASLGKGHWEGDSLHWRQLPVKDAGKGPSGRGERGKIGMLGLRLATAHNTIFTPLLTYLTEMQWNLFSPFPWSCKKDLLRFSSFCVTVSVWHVQKQKRLGPSYQELQGPKANERERRRKGKISKTKPKPGCASAQLAPL